MKVILLCFCFTGHEFKYLHNCHSHIFITDTHIEILLFTYCNNKTDITQIILIEMSGFVYIDMVNIVWEFSFIGFH